MISGNTYEEVYEILSYMDKMTVMKIPRDILNNIKEQRNTEFKTRINKDDIFNQQNVSKEAIDILCWIDFNYWMNSSQKNEIEKWNYRKKILEEEKKQNNYNYNDMFKKVGNLQNSLKEKKSLMIKKEHWYNKILNLITKLKK